MFWAHPDVPPDSDHYNQKIDQRSAENDHECHLAHGVRALAELAGLSFACPSRPSPAVRCLGGSVAFHGSPLGCLGSGDRGLAGVGAK